MVPIICMLTFTLHCLSFNIWGKKICGIVAVFVTYSKLIQVTINWLRKLVMGFNIFTQNKYKHTHKLNVNQ